MSDNLIKHMVDRFLSWKLPENFRPDCGIHFDADAAKKLNPRNARFEPNGTNLFDATQAEAMVRHMLQGAPIAGSCETCGGKQIIRIVNDLYRPDRDAPCPTCVGWPMPGSAGVVVKSVIPA